MRSSITQSNIQLASKLLKLNANKAKPAPITEGTPTTALTPDTDATRQKDQDIALAMNKVGIPAPAGGVPAPNHGEFAMGTQDPMGADEPAHEQPGPGGQDSGMAKPEDRRGDNYNAGPGTGTESEVGGLNAGAEKKWEGTEFEGWSDEEIVEAFIYVTGNLEEATWALLTRGIAIEEAEVTLYTGEVTEQTAKTIVELFGLFGKNKESNQAKKKAAWMEKNKVRLNAGKDSTPKFVNSDKPPAGWSSTKSVGHDARRNK